MEQEAYLLARSQFNNTLWIKYLCEAEEGDNTRLKEFFYQPDINQLRSNQNLKKMIRDFGDTLDERFKGEETITKLNRGSKEIRKILKKGESGRKIQRALQNMAQTGSDFIWDVYYLI